MKTFIASTFALLMTATVASAQPSEGKGGAPVTGQTAAPANDTMAPGSSPTSIVRPTDSAVTAPATTSPNPSGPSGAPVPNAAISKPPGDAAAPAGR